MVSLKDYAVSTSHRRKTTSISPEFSALFLGNVLVQIKKYS